MSLKSSASQYGTVAITLHWLSALLILALFVSGSIAEDTPNSADKAAILRLHAPLGISILIVTLARILWWLVADHKPRPVEGMPRWQEIVATSVHHLLYVGIIIMVASGIGTLVVSGAGEIIFTGAPGPLPDLREVPPRAVHGLGATFMIILLLLHIAGALQHQFIRKDGLLRRMWYSG